MENLALYALPLFIVVMGLETKSLNMAGAVTALLMAYVIMLSQNVWWFLVLLVFLLMGTVTTKYKEEKKEKLQVLQQVRGPRNVLANGGVAMLMAVLAAIPGTNWMVGFYGFIGAVAAAASDTISSELGVLTKTKPFMITTGKQAKTGTNGAISFGGTLCGLGAAFLIGLVCLPIFFSINTLIVATIAGIFGNLADSLFGAVFENRGWWGNATTNILATVVGAIIAILIGAAL